VRLTSLLVIAGSLLAIALWEFCRPRRRREFAALRRRLGNLGIWLLNIVLVAFVFSPTDSFRPQLEAVTGLHLPSWPIGNRWASFVAAFLLLDFLVYAVHRCQHAVPLLWRFHALHHSDPDVDVTTSVRHHPLEYVSAAGFYWVAVLALDIPTTVVAIHTLVIFAMAAITHGNIRLPGWLERSLQPVVITLDLHLVHHSMAPSEFNANFGGVFSIWDRMFGTFKRLSRDELDQLTFGVAALRRADGIKPTAMLMTPWLLVRSPPTPAANSLR
jgi:sterol desaturase/sphingolipid hydroxylase (fatty acid hydroxylase superfamily)